MNYYWALHPSDYEDGLWHLISGDWRSGVGNSRVVGICGFAFKRDGWVRGNESGWKWIREYRAVICIGCLDNLLWSRTRPEMKGLRDMLGTAQSAGDKGS